MQRPSSTNSSMTRPDSSTLDHVQSFLVSVQAWPSSRLLAVSGLVHSGVLGKLTAAQKTTLRGHFRDAGLAPILAQALVGSPPALKLFDKPLQDLAALRAKAEGAQTQTQLPKDFEFKPSGAQAPSTPTIHDTPVTAEPVEAESAGWPWAKIGIGAALVAGAFFAYKKWGQA